MKRWPALLLLAPACTAFADDRQGILSSPTWAEQIPSLVSKALGPLDSPNAGDDTFVKIRAGGMFAFADGEITVGDMVGGATNVLDFEDTLGQDTDDFSPIGSITIAIPIIDLSIEFGYMGSYEFAGTTTNTVSFDDQEFSGTIDSSEDLTMYELNVLYELAEIKFVTIYVGGGARVIDAEAIITGDVMGTTTTETQDAIIPIPVGSVGANFDLGRNIAIRGNLAGMYFGDYGTVIDAKAEIGYDFHRMFGVFVGYRFMNFESTEFDVEVDATMQGLYAGAELRF
jgi:hypothetical protein